MLPHFLARELHDVYLVLIAVELEHVVHVDFTGTHNGVEGEGSVEGYVGSSDGELELVDEVAECRAAEEGVLCINTFGYIAYLLVYE